MASDSVWDQDSDAQGSGGSGSSGSSGSEGIFFFLQHTARGYAPEADVLYMTFQPLPRNLVR